MNSHEEIVRFFSSHLMTISLCLLSTSLSNIECWSSSMMSISNVSVRNSRKFLLKEIRVLSTAFPYSMANAIVSCYISIRFCSCYYLHHFLFNCFTVSECQENWTNISILNIIEFSSVFLLLFDCEFMSLYQPILIIFNWS
jgi:hypothetical protein